MPRLAGDLRGLGLGGVPAAGVQLGVGARPALHRPLADLRVLAGPSPPRPHAGGVRRRRGRARTGSGRGRAPRGRRCAGPAAGSRPRRCESPVPEAGWPSPARILVSVVLPAPLRPTRPTLSPAATRKVTSSMRSRAPARTSSCWAVIMRVAILRRGGVGAPSATQELLCGSACHERHDPRKGTPMRFNPKARLDTSRVSDAGRGGGGGMGGGGDAHARCPAARAPAAASAASSSSSCSSCSPSAWAAAAAAARPTRGPGAGHSRAASTPATERYANCKTGADANDDPDCARDGRRELARALLGRHAARADRPEFAPAQIVTFTGAVDTGCGQATSARRPVLLPADQQIYLDTDVLRRRARAAARRPGRRLRGALRARPRVRPPHPEPARAPWARSAPSRAPTPTPCASSCRPTATPACGPARHADQDSDG